MRVQIILLLFVLPRLVSGQCHPEWNGVLRNSVQGNSVELRNDTATRECGMTYEMDVYGISGDTLVWIEREVGAAANCLCHYNFSVTVDSLANGEYYAKVYYRRFGQTIDCYIGTMRFQISVPLANSSPEAVNPYQSPCFYVPVGQENENQHPSMKLFPNPVTGRITLEVGTNGHKVIVLTNSIGQQVLRHTTTESRISLDVSDYPGRGIYLITVTTDRTILQGRFLKN